MFELTIKTDNPALLIAIANVVKNTPPVGYNEGKPVEVNVHASLKDMKAAVDNVDLAPNAKVKEEPIDEPTTKPVDPLASEAAKDKGQRIRKLLLAVSKLDGQDIQSAIAVAAKAAGVEPSGVNKAFPSHPKADEAIKSLEAMLA
jgi:hypothetical protein